MEQNLQTKLIDINKAIEALDIEIGDKAFLYRIEKCIIASPNGRVYTKNTKDYQEYLCFKIPRNSSTKGIKFCISKRMIDHAGGSAGRKNSFPSYPELIKYVNQHREQIEAELNSIEYYVAQQNEQKKSESVPSILEVVHEKVAKIPASETKKARVFAVLDAIAANPNTKIYTVREESYEEFISLINGYLTVTERMVDYAGTPQGKNVYILKSNKIIDYVEQHKTLIDENLSKPKKL